MVGLTTGFRSAFPLDHTVQVRPWVDTAGEDMFGQSGSGWGADIALDVLGWSTPSATELGAAGHDNRIIWDIDLYAPTGTIGHRDRVLIGQELYEVTGIANYDNGPKGWLRPGLDVVRLKKVEG